jgi:dolichol-phosphate mannosyltransferase
MIDFDPDRSGPDLGLTPADRETSVANRPLPMPDCDHSGAIRSRTDWPSGRVLVQAATFDERENILRLIDAVLAVSPELQLLIIDDDSPDGTGRVALARAEQEPRLHVLVRRGRRGLGGAIQEGLEEARRQGFEIVVNMDADFSHDPADIPRLVVALEPPGGRPVDAVIGSRRVCGGRTVGWPLARQVASRLVSWFTRWVLRVPVRDPSSGFRALRVSTIATLEGPFSQAYAFHEDILWRLRRAGGRIVEVPITFTDRTRGSSKADLAASRRSILELLVLARKTWFG